MKNQNAYAPVAEPLGDDVLEIPRPVQATEHTVEQQLVLEDVIAMPPSPDLSSPWDEEAAPALQAQDYTDDDDTLWLEPDEETIVTSRVVPSEEREMQAGADVLGSSQASSPDYEGYGAWVRMAPLFLLVGALVFFTLYYLGNRVGSGDRAQNASTNPAPAETSSAIPGSAPPIVESSAAPATQPAESSVVGAKAESPAPEEKSKVETAKPETPPPAATAAAPPPTPAAVAPSTPSAEQGVGNYTVQVGSYNNAAQAEERVGQLSSNGVEARVVRAEIPRRGTWYRVQAGRFASHEEAARFGAQLKGKGATDNFIITEVQSR
jgi:cell division septation protein DedD